MFFHSVAVPGHTQQRVPSGLMSATRSSASDVSRPWWRSRRPTDAVCPLRVAWSSSDITTPTALRLPIACSLSAAPRSTPTVNAAQLTVPAQRSARVVLPSTCSVSRYAAPLRMRTTRVWPGFVETTPMSTAVLLYFLKLVTVTVSATRG